MLDTIPAYAGERFALTTDKDAVHQRHCLHYLALARRHGTERALWGAGGKEHLAGLDAEIERRSARTAKLRPKRGAALAPRHPFATSAPGRSAPASASEQRCSTLALEESSFGARWLLSGAPTRRSPVGPRP
jgi:hypothetical protein